MIEKKRIENYVFDDKTHEALFKLSNNSIIDSIETPISSGKEAITFIGHLGESALVAKIYKIETSKFKNMQKYIKGDHRFKNIGKEKRDIIEVWASKEYKNLALALNSGVVVPVPIAKEKNILIMSLIGKDNMPFPQLVKVKFDFDIVYPQIVENYARMLYGAKLVHADFSAYNILIDPETQKIAIIDVGQSVLQNHPKAKDFLKRDILNITEFLTKKFRGKEITPEMFLEDIKNKKEEIYGRDT
ncbi:MAG: RIO1 family regulatory kinase/ATPase [archaeon]|jgi:RIO kinase 1